MSETGSAEKSSLAMFAFSYAAWFASGLMVVSVFSGEGLAVTSSPHISALALILLVLSLPMIDAALFGPVRPHPHAAFPPGLGFGFFVHQVHSAETNGQAALAAGAERALLTAFVLSVAIHVARRIRRRRGGHKR